VQQSRRKSQGSSMRVIAIETEKWQCVDNRSEKKIGG